MRIVLLGAPGVGKGAHADLLNLRLNARHLSTGAVFRAAAGQSDPEQSPAMKEALAHMRRGELVPDSTVWDMVRERIECLHWTGGFTLDGFPGTLAQAVSLKQLMDDEGLGLTAVVNDELASQRDRGRPRRPPNVREVQNGYHVTERPPKVRRAAIAATGGCFSGKMTVQSRSRSAWRLTSAVQLR